MEGSMETGTRAVRFAVLALGVLLLREDASAGELPIPSYICHRAGSKIVIDGDLHDRAWQKAPRIELVNTEDGRTTKASTKAAILWDDQYLYILFDALDNDIWGTMTRRDDLVYTEEVVEAFLDPDGDGFDYFEVNVSPRNTVFDARIWNPTGRQPDPDAVGRGWTAIGMRTAVRVQGTIDNRGDTDIGWTAEIAIPFTALRAFPERKAHWRANLYRINLTPETEFQAWSPTLASPAAFHIPARFGELIFEE